MSDWKADLKDIFTTKETKEEEDNQRLKKVNSEISRFISTTVIPAFEEIKEEIEKNYQRTVKISISTKSATIKIEHYSATEFEYSIKFQIHQNGVYPYSEEQRTDKKGKFFTEGFLRSGSQDYTTADITKDEIINHTILEYKKRMS
jgi:choline/glycine/proline betaine transport protein